MVHRIGVRLRQDVRKLLELEIREPFPEAAHTLNAYEPYTARLS